jgi:hypothetical protein
MDDWGVQASQREINLPFSFIVLKDVVMVFSQYIQRSLSATSLKMVHDSQEQAGCEVVGNLSSLVEGFGGVINANEHDYSVKEN